jgi:D-alanine-D-alanine ligase
MYSNNKKNNHNMKDKTLLIVNTGTKKKERTFFQQLKRLGVNVVALNSQKNWAEPYVNHWIIADTNNHIDSINAVKQFIETNPNIKINGAMTFWEDDVILTSKIVDRFNFIGIPYAVAQKTRNKFLFRQFCKENGIPFPNHILVESDNDIDRIAKELKFPLVIKPIFGSSSAFVIKVEDKDELIKAYNFVKNNISTNVETALAEGYEILVEEYIDGDEVDIDMLLQNGKVKFFSIADNYQTKEPFFLETGYQLPSGLPEKNQEELIEMAEEVTEKLGIQNGILHFEAKSTTKGAYPIEVNLRMGGDEVYPSTKAVWGVDLIEYAVKIALGEYVKIDKPETPKKYIRGTSLQAEDSGIVSQLYINDEIKTKKYIEEIHFNKKVGEPVLAPPEGYEFLGWLTVSGENPLDADENLEEALDNIEYTIAEFDPASSIGKTSRKNPYSVATLKKQIVLGSAKIEKIRNIEPGNLKNLHIGIACNIYNGNGNAVEQDLMSVGKNIENTLNGYGYKVTYFDFNNLPKAFNDLRKSNVDLVFNVCERINNSSLLEPHAAAILDTLQIPYTGSNPFTLGLCIDKIRVKKLLNYHHIPTAKWDYAYSVDDEIDEELKYPLIVKPANTDNSIGITNSSVVTDKKQLQEQINYVINVLGRPALIEEYIDGDEYDVSILGDEQDELKVLPLSRSVFTKMKKGEWHIYTHDVKFGNISPKDKGIIVQRPSKSNNKNLESLISEMALDTYNILDCHDYGRVEIKVDDDGNPYVLELNPNPSINIHDCVPTVAKLVGLSYGDFLEEIMRMTIRRYKNKPPYYHLQANII